MNKTTENILNSKKNRFPENAWKRLNEIYSLFEKGEITEEQLDSSVFSIADIYDNIKPGERWWGNCDNNILGKPIIITQENALQYEKNFGTTGGKN